MPRSAARRYDRLDVLHRSRGKWLRGRLACALAALSAACAQTERPHLLVTGAPPPARDRPLESPAPRFVGSDACRSCHAREYETWHASFHRTMTQSVGPDTVIARWDGELTLGEERFVLERRGDEFWIEMDDPDVGRDDPEWPEGPPRVWRQAVQSTGAHNFQAYWFPSGSTRKLYLFMMVWRVDEQRWMPIDAAFVDPPNSRREPTLPRWNLVCLKCHTTKPMPRIAGGADMQTQVTEFGIACEACHGPAREHVEANENPLRRYELHFTGEKDTTIVNPADLTAAESSQVCGQCHGITEFKSEQNARWNEHGFLYEPGKNLFAHRTLTTEGVKSFWSDGQVRVSGREFNGLVRSPCFQHGDESRRMECISCHRMHRASDDPRPIEEWRVHQLGAEMAGNEGCTQCHAEYAEPDRLAAHTRHAPDSTASSCYECHMPRTVWGLLKAIRSHQITSPTVQESLATGRPNACNLCHLDRTLAWTAEELNAGYGTPIPALTDEQSTVAAGALWTLTGDAGQRAILAWHMGWQEAQATAGSAWMAPYLATLVDDAYDAVRFRARRSLRTLPGFTDLDYDFVGTPEELARVRAEVFEQWRSKNDAALDLPQLLIEHGALRESEFEGLLDRRDHRRMALAE